MTFSALKDTPAAVYPLGAGLLATSSLLFGNLGLSAVGPLPIIKDQLGASKLSNKQKVKVWRLFFDEAAKYVVIGTGATAVLHLGAGVLANSSLVRKLSIASALCSAVVLPYTLKVIMPTNTALIELDDKSGADEDESEAEGDADEEKQTAELIETWDRLHKYRFAMYGSAWLLGISAFVKAF